MATQELHYNIESIINKAHADVLYFLHGKEMDLSRDAIEDDDDTHLKRWLSSIASRVFIILHRRGRGIVDSYQFDVEITDLIGDYISYTIEIPDNFDDNLISSLDDALEIALIKNLSVQWYKRKGIENEEARYEALEAYAEIKRIINFRIGLKRTYRWY